VAKEERSPWPSSSQSAVVGQTEGILYAPDGLAFDATGNLYVTCYGSSAIYTG
jgi:sugar lactone lactonase YvrE